MLKSVLYLILAVCISWGLVLISGPQIIRFLQTKTYGDNLRIYDLRVTPKLELVASRIEFSDVNLISNNSGTGSIRGVKLSWTFFDKFFSEIILNTGPLFLNESIIIKNSSVNFSGSNFWGTGFLDFSIKADDINFLETANVGNITALGVYDYRSFEFTNIEFQGNDLAAQKNLKLKVPRLMAQLKV